MPGFEDQLKEIREGYAKEYEDKMKRGFQELKDLKKDIAQKQEVFDTKQVRDLRREIKKLEDDCMEQRNENVELKGTVDTLKMVVKEKEIQIDKLMNNTQNRDGQLDKLKDQIKEKDLHIESMLVKMDLFKKNIDDLNFKYLEASKLLEQMKSQDFAK